MSPVRFAGGGTLKTTGGKLGNVVNGTFQQKWPLSNTINFSNLWNAPQPDGVDPKVAANPTLQAIKDKPMPTWVGNFKSTVQAEVDLVTSYIAQTAGKTSIWVTYGVPNRDLGNYSGGGFTSRAAYIDWVTRIRDALGTAPVVIISEPDALGQSRQISDATQKADRIENLRQANTILAAAPNSKVYIDAAHWVPAAEQAALLHFTLTVIQL
jgi:endoglucanase